MVLDRRDNTKRKLEVLSGYAGTCACTQCMYMYMCTCALYMNIWLTWPVPMLCRRTFLMHLYMNHVMCTHNYVLMLGLETNIDV